MIPDNKYFELGASSLHFRQGCCQPLRSRNLEQGLCGQKFGRRNLSSIWGRSLEVVSGSQSSCPLSPVLIEIGELQLH
jgi:hypothetical protein